MPETRPEVYGPIVDDQTRCIHYATELACCDRYYPCHLCHAASETHPPTVWPRSSRDQRAVLCGVCGSELTIAAYLAVDGCPGCGAAFNPGCRLHSHLYFEI
jgi:uncharacterized CHY-type Zn-finger protein